MGDLLLPVGHRAFADTAPGRMLLWPTDGFLLSEQQFDALAFAAGRERHAYMVAIEGLADPTDADECWRISLDSYADYRWLKDGRDPGTEHPLVAELENCICSVRGRWGVYVALEHWAIVGGSKRFIAAMRSRLPTADEQVRDFVRGKEDERERAVSDISWVRPLLVHLYGERNAERFLRPAAPE